MTTSRRIREARRRPRRPYIITYPQPITREFAEIVKARFLEAVGRQRVVILDNGAQVTR